MPEPFDEARRALEQVEAPDLWPEVERRAALIGAAEPAGAAGSQRRWLPALAAAAAVAVIAATAYVLSPEDGDERLGTQPSTTGEQPACEPLVGLLFSTDLTAPPTVAEPGQSVSFPVAAATVEIVVQEPQDERGAAGTPLEYVDASVGAAAVHVDDRNAVTTAYAFDTRDPCRRYRLRATGGAGTNDRLTAVRYVAERLRLATPEYAAGAECGVLSLATTSPPDGFDPLAARAITGRGDRDGPTSILSFDGGETQVDVVQAPPAGWLTGAGFSTPLGVAHVGTVDAEVRADLAFGDRSDLPGCRIGLASSDVTEQELGDLVRGLYLVDERGRPRFEPAVWPETAAGQRGYDQLPWRDDAGETALEFARQVLGWDDAVLVASGGEPSEDGQDGAVLQVTRSTRADEVSLWVAPTSGGRWYGVYRVDSRCCDDSTASVEVNGTMAWAHAGPAPEGAVASRVRFDYGGRIVDRVLRPEQRIDLGFVPDSTGSVLVLWVDSTGEVVGAWGTTLPPGDFAEG